MSFDKSRFTTNPQHDSEGFTSYEARCFAECTNSDLAAMCKLSEGALPCSQAVKVEPSVWSQISDEDLERVHDYWTRQAVLA